jgi:hypothetical protein
MPPSCVPLSEDVIAIQRQWLAQKVLEAKGLTAASHSSRSIPLNEDLAAVRAAPMEFHQGDKLTPDYDSHRLVQSTSSLKQGYHDGDDARSISTATMTAMSVEAAPPLHLPTFKPAIGCITANEFLVRCFVARLRSSGVTVIKHSRSRFKKASRPCKLKLDEDGETLIWMSCRSIEEAEKSWSGQGAKRLNLSTCKEVRMALTPDPTNPIYTGTAILREQCEGQNAHKSFALIFDQRSFDVTSLTEDQCKMLVEGFSALCYRLHQKENDVVLREHKNETTISKKNCIQF